jgi:hypothetical protein
MKLDKIVGSKLFDFAKRTALKLAAREIARILAKADLPKDVSVEALESGVVVKGKNIKARTVTEPAVRDIAR